MDGGSRRAAGMLNHASDSPSSSSSRLRRRVFLSAPMPSFDARNSNKDLALVVAAPPPCLTFDPSSSTNHKQTTGFSSNTVISSSSSGSGTIVSTTNTSRSSGSSLHLYLFDDEDDSSYTLKPREETEKKRMNNIKSLVQEFFGASSSSPSANCTTNGGDMSILERWFTELGVDWVLHISEDDGSVAGIQADHTFDFDPRSWIRALNEIIKTIRLTTSFFSDRCGFVGMPSICEEEEEEAAAAEAFFRKSVRELSNYIIRREENQIQKAEKVEEAESCILDQFQFARFIQKTMLKMLAFIDFLVALDPNTICDFSVVSGSGVPSPALYQKISILLRVLDALSYALFEIEVLLLSTPLAEVKRIRGEMLNLLYAKDNKATEAVWGTMEEIWALIMEEDGQDSVMTRQGSSDIHKDYIQAYLQLCWVPALSSLLNPTPHCFGKSYSPLPKFECEIHKIYTTQKLWKVPDPELRKTMREAITMKIIPGYTRYIEDNKVSTTKFTPQNLEEMLQELFEG